MPTDDERREVARRLRHEARTCIHSVLLSPDDALRLADLIEPAPKCSEATPKCDRDALLDLADLMEGSTFEYSGSDDACREFAEFANEMLGIYAKGIREACGEAGR